MKVDTPGHPAVVPSTSILVRALVGGLCVAALAAIVALLGGLGDTAWRVVGTSLGFSFYIALGAAGESLRRNGSDPRGVGAATITLAGLSFLLLVIALWAPDEYDAVWRAWGACTLLALFGSHASVVLRARRSGDSSLIDKLVATSLLTAAIAALVGDVAIVGLLDDVEEDAWARGLGVVLVIAVLSTALQPILRRLDGTPDDDSSSLRIAHTADLDATTLEAAHALLVAVFPGEFTDSDWEHGLGGIHVLAYENGELVGHASVVQRRMIIDGVALRTGYVEGVGVHADARRRGHGAAMMEALERVIRQAYDLGALAATDEGAALYEQRGWRRWEGQLFALTPDGRVRTPDEEGGVHVFGDAHDRTGDLTCDWRDGDVW